MSSLGPSLLRLQTAGVDKRSRAQTQTGDEFNHESPFIKQAITPLPLNERSNLLEQGKKTFKSTFVLDPIHSK